MKTPIAKTGDDLSSETEGEAGPLPPADAAEGAPRRRAPGGGMKSAAAVLGPKGRAIRMARAEGGGNVTPLSAGRRKPPARADGQPAPGEGPEGGSRGQAGQGAKAGGGAMGGKPGGKPGARPAPRPPAQQLQAPEPAAVVSAEMPAAAPQTAVEQPAPAMLAPVSPAQIQPIPGGKRGRQAPAADQPLRAVVTVKAARMQARHFALMALFALLVLLPSALYGTYLYTIAVDQYESDVGFGSRTQQASSTFDILGVLGGSSAVASKDMDILNQFITSQELVERIDKRLDLRKIYTRFPQDWYFSFDPKGPIEDLVEYWKSMVVVNYDSSTGLMSLQVYAFTPEDAQAIAQAVVDESGAIINELSKTAQEDTTRYSRETLQKAEDRYRKAQNDLADFRIKNRIVDPQLELSGASQIINGLAQQMAEAQINLELLRGQVADSDPRIAQLTRRIDVIRKRISEETSKVGNVADPTDPGYASLIRDYQSLQMEMEFGQKAYMAAQGAYDQAVSDAQQQTHYLATFLKPTVAQSSTAPNRPLNIMLTALVGLLAWSMITMVYYALRDRR